MKKIKYSLIPTLLFSTIFLACQSSNSTHNNKTQQIEKENEQLKKENEQLKKEQSQNTVSYSENTTSAPTSSQENDLSFLKTYNGKYTFDVHLFEQKAFTDRLKKLLGNERYKFLYTIWSVETPMTFEDNVFSASACQQHNCPATNFIIVMDFNTNIMHCGIREEFTIKTYSEDGSKHPLIHKWENE